MSKHIFDKNLKLKFFSKIFFDLKTLSNNKLIKIKYNRKRFMEKKKEEVILCAWDYEGA